MGLVEFSKGNLVSGYRKAMAVQKMYLRSGSFYMNAVAESIMGKTHLQVILSKKPVPFSVFMRDFFWIVGHVPSAFHRAKSSFTKAIEITERQGLQGMLAEAWRDMGTLYMTKKKHAQAGKCFTTAIKLYKELGSLKLCAEIQQQLEAAKT
jgi:tetratricopeptide (TPR) repeat protein